MTKISFRHHLAAIVATLFVSTACVVGAVGPAAADNAPMVADLRA